MAEVKFVTIAKYKGVSHPAHTPFTVEDKDVESLVRDGAIVTVPPQAVPQSSEVSIDNMKVDELKAYAESNNIDIGKAQKKADILAAIKAATRSEEE